MSKKNITLIILQGFISTSYALTKVWHSTNWQLGEGCLT